MVAQCAGAGSRETGSVILFIIIKICRIWLCMSTTPKQSIRLARLRRQNGHSGGANTVKLRISYCAVRTVQCVLTQAEGTLSTTYAIDYRAVLYTIDYVEGISMLTAYETVAQYNEAKEDLSIVRSPGYEDTTRRRSQRDLDGLPCHWLSLQINCLRLLTTVGILTGVWAPPAM